MNNKKKIKVAGIEIVTFKKICPENKKQLS